MQLFKSNSLGRFKLQTLSLLISSAYLLSLVGDLSYIRIALSFLLLGYVPGSLLVQSLFSNKRIPFLERILINVAASLLITTSIAMLMNFFGISLDALNLTIALLLTILILCFVSIFVLIKIPEVIPNLGNNSPTKKVEVGKYTSSFLLLSLAMLIAIYIIWLGINAENGEVYTEFYMLPESRSAHNINQLENTRSITFGINNRSDEPKEYYLEIYAGDTLISTEGLLSLDIWQRKLINVELPEDYATMRLKARYIDLSDPFAENVLFFYPTN